VKAHQNECNLIAARGRYIAIGPEQPRDARARDQILGAAQIERRQSNRLVVNRLDRDAALAK